MMPDAVMPDPSCYLRLLVQSSLLTDDDFDTLLSHDEAVVTRARRANEHQHTCFKIANFLWPGVYAFGTLVGVGLLLTSMLASRPTLSNLHRSIGGLAVTWLGYRTIASIARYRYTSSACNSAAVIASLIDAQQSIVTQSARALRMIHETELVARGYAVSAHVGAASRVEWRNEHFNCIPLRQILARSLADMTKTWRSATLALMSNVPLAPVIDSPSLYLAKSPFSELGLFLC